jgi:glyoxylase-like metal-dependent hydrolase (beta-lactamase superfamily II)
MRVGELEVVPVWDGSAQLDPTAFVAGSTHQDWQSHPRLLDADGRLPIELGGFLVRGGRALILVDAGIGPITVGPFGGGAFLRSLAGHGVEPTRITDVVFTHLHFDHVGWASLGGEAVFPNATYHCSALDWDYLVGTDARVTEKLEPLRDRFRFWQGDGELSPGLAIRGAPGHTPGSTIVIVSSGAERAFLLGDVAHSPLQLLKPELPVTGDVDRALARRTRRLVSTELQATGVPAVASHFPGLRFGCLIETRGHREWRLANEVG